FWGAKQVMAFSDEDIDTIIGTGKLSDPKAVAYLAECLRERRDKIGRIYFAKVLPFDRFRVEGGRLSWDDLSQVRSAAGVKDTQVRWSLFDNATNTKTAIPGAVSAEVPAEGEYLAAEISCTARPKQTVTAYVRRNGGATKVVGIDRTW
ncbi:MAG: hypothetical protein ABIZ80_02775, partial [Bryobacteraceae bacterium]